MVRMPRWRICRQPVVALGAAALAASGSLVACGGGGSGGNSGGGPYEVRVTVSGLDGSGLILQNNSGDDLTVAASGEQIFASRLANGVAYNVRVKAQPRMLQQNCTVFGGTGAVAAAAVTNVSVVCVTPTPLFAYAANSNNATGNDLAATGSVSAYKVDTLGGLNAANGGVWASVQRRPAAVAVDSQGEFVYLGRSGDSGATALVAYAINGTTGALTLRSGISEFSSVAYPQAIALGPSGTQLFVAGNGSGAGAQLALHILDSVSGGLELPSFLATWSGYSVSALVADPQGRFVVVGLTGTSGNKLAVFGRDTRNGTLTAWPTLVDVTTLPRALAIDPGGRWLYMASNGPGPGDHLVRAFQLPSDANEVLSSIGTPTTVDDSPVDLTVHPRGTHLYVVRQARTGRKVAVFPLGASGALGTEVPEQNVGDHGTGSDPAQIRIDARGTYAYVSNSGSNTISIFRVDPSTGGLTPAATPVGTGTAPLGLALIAR